MRVGRTESVWEGLGHSTIVTTVDIYSHIARGLRRDAGDRFDEAVVVKW